MGNGVTGIVICGYDCGPGVKVPLAEPDADRKRSDAVAGSGADGVMGGCRSARTQRIDRGVSVRRSNILRALVTIAVAAIGVAAATQPASASAPVHETALTLAPVAQAATPAGARPNFLLRNQNSNECLEIVNSTPENFGRADQFPCTGGLNQQWNWSG